MVGNRWRGGSKCKRSIHAPQLQRARAQNPRLFVFCHELCCDAGFGLHGSGGGAAAAARAASTAPAPAASLLLPAKTLAQKINVLTHLTRTVLKQGLLAAKVKAATAAFFTVHLCKILGT